MTAVFRQRCWSSIHINILMQVSQRVTFCRWTSLPFKVLCGHKLDRQVYLGTFYHAECSSPFLVIMFSWLEILISETGLPLASIRCQMFPRNNVVVLGYKVVTVMSWSSCFVFVLGVTYLRLIPWSNFGNLKSSRRVTGPSHCIYYMRRWASILQHLRQVWKDFISDLKYILWKSFWNLAWGLQGTWCERHRCKPWWTASKPFLN